LTSLVGGSPPARRWLYAAAAHVKFLLAYSLQFLWFRYGLHGPFSECFSAFYAQCS